MPEVRSARATLGVLFFKRQWRLFGIMLKSPKSVSSIMFAALVILSLLMQVIIYEAGLVPSMYFECLGAKDLDEFKRVAIYSMEIIVINAVMKSALTYLSQMLFVKWREMVCSHLHNRYFADTRYYKVNVSNPTLDNVDQRIVRDTSVFCQEWSTLMSRLVVIPFTIVYYSYQCFVSTTYLGPIIIYSYFIGGSILNRFLMAPIVRMTVQREKCEGDFRFQHAQVRVNAESMAFYNADEIEKYKSDKKLKVLLGAQKTLYGWSFWLNSSVNIFDYVGGILSYLIIAIPIFGGQYDDLAPEELSAVISKNSFVCMYLIHSFSQLFDMSRTVSDIAGHTHRLGELIEELDKEESENPDPGNVGKTVALLEGKDDSAYQKFENDEYDDEMMDTLSDLPSHVVRSQDVCFELKQVTYRTPDGSTELLRNFNMTIPAGENLLVTGTTGSGKTSLFRILRTLWRPDSGTVTCYRDRGPGGVMFMPQKPVCTDGTLKQLVVYPSMDAYKGYSLSTDEARIMEVLDEVGLTDLYVRMGGMDGREEVNWADKLSPGEMQRLSFARLFYHHPRFAVMDEPTSALNTEMADMLFEFCKKKGITCVTAGHGDVLLKHHHNLLHLNGDGGWNYSTLL